MCWVWAILFITKSKTAKQNECKTNKLICCRLFYVVSKLQIIILLTSVQSFIWSSFVSRWNVSFVCNSRAVCHQVSWCWWLSTLAGFPCNWAPALKRPLRHSAPFPSLSKSKETRRKRRKEPIKYLWGINVYTGTGRWPRLSALMPLWYESRAGRGRKTGACCVCSLQKLPWMRIKQRQAWPKPSTVGH